MWGLPHCSHSWAVSGNDASSMVLITSTNGTSATRARNRSGRMFTTAHEEPSRATAVRHESVGSRVPAAHQVLRHVDVVAERVHLVHHLAVVVPRPAHLL